MKLFIQRALPVMGFCVLPMASVVAGAPDPLQAMPGASLPAYRSAFSNYKPLAADKPGDWRALNEAVQGEGMAGMAGMAGMPNMAKGAHDAMPGMGEAPGRAMPMPMPLRMPKGHAPAASMKPHPPAAAASMPAMKGMPDMPGMPEMPAHSRHDLSGGKP